MLVAVIAALSLDSFGFCVSELIPRISSAPLDVAIELVKVFKCLSSDSNIVDKVNPLVIQQIVPFLSSPQHVSSHQHSLSRKHLDYGHFDSLLLGCRNCKISLFRLCIISVESKRAGGRLSPCVEQFLICFLCVMKTLCNNSPTLWSYHFLLARNGLLLIPHFVSFSLF